MRFDVTRRGRRPRAKERKTRIFFLPFFFSEFALSLIIRVLFFLLVSSVKNMSSKKKKQKSRRKKKKAPTTTTTTTTTTRVNSERRGNELWQIVTDHPDIFGTHVVPKLNGNDVKFFYDVNTESRATIKRSGVQLRDAFKIGDFDTKSTISWALEKCLERRERFCARMAENGNFDLLQFLHEKGCPWDEWTCAYAAQNGHLECLKYACENGCPGSWAYEHRFLPASTPSGE